jgi:hypothetical protein
MQRHHIAVCAVLFAASACGEHVELIASVDGVTRSRHGDTVIVHTDREGEWGTARDAHEVLRVSGSGPDAPFGAVSILAATPDGGVLIVDSKGPDGLVVRQFDSTGTFVRNIGRSGAGPGEYNQRGLVFLAVHKNGTIVLRDGARAVNRYTSDGTFINSFALGLPNAGSFDLVAADDGTIFLRGPFPRSAGPLQRVPSMLRYDTTGKLIDSIVDPGRWIAGDDPPALYTASQVWYIHPDARTLVIRSDKLGFLLSDRTNANPPLIGTAAAASVPFLDEERAELQAADDFKQRTRPAGQRAAAVKIPENKLPASWALTDINDRIWILRAATGVKTAPRVVARTGPDSVIVSYADPPVFAAFKPDGTFLGEIRFPMGVFIPTFVGNTAWATVPDENDVPVLVKFAIRK